MDLTVEHRLTAVEEKTRNNTERIDSHDQKMEDIVKMLSARPTWLTTALITILTTVTCSLIVYVVTVHH